MPVLEVSREELMKMKGIVLGSDCDGALRLIKVFLKRLETEERKAFKSIHD